MRRTQLPLGGSVEGKVSMVRRSCGLMREEKRMRDIFWGGFGQGAEREAAGVRVTAAVR
jgi:hypothetical protein